VALLTAPCPDWGWQMIHAHGDLERVVEHGLDATWRERVSAAFRFRGF
jgi:hypothetical protein